MFGSTARSLPRSTATLCAAAVLVSACGGGETMLPLAGRADVDALFAEYEQPGSPGCALGVIQDGEFVYRRGYGLANLEHEVPITSDTVFRIGSVSKQFTAMVILLLDEAGTLSLDDDLRRWVPEMPDLGPITIRHLLHHTSGLRDYLVLTRLAGYREQEFYTAADLLELLTRQRALNFAPGDEFLYSNSGYFLLATIAERATGRSLRALGEELIFGPLGMDDTQFYDDTTRVVPRRASGYTRADDGYAVSMTTLPIVGDGGVFTSVNDLLAWDSNFYDNRLGRGSAELVERWLTPGTLNDGAPVGRGNLGYGAGIMVGEYRGAEIVAHGGAFVGFRADMVRLPQHRTTVITLCNVAEADPSRLARQVVDLYLGDGLAPAAPPDGRPAADTQADGADDEFSVPVSQLREYEGRYISRELGVTYLVEIDNGRLGIRLPTRWSRQLRQIDVDVMQEPSTGVVLRFGRDTRGAMTGFSLDWGRVTGLWFERVG